MSCCSVLYGVGLICIFVFFFGMWFFVVGTDLKKRFRRIGD